MIYKSIVILQSCKIQVKSTKAQCFCKGGTEMSVFMFKQTQACKLQKKLDVNDVAFDLFIVSARPMIVLIFPSYKNILWKFKSSNPDCLHSSLVVFIDKWPFCIVTWLLALLHVFLTFLPGCLHDYSRGFLAIQFFPAYSRFAMLLCSLRGYVSVCTIFEAILYIKESVTFARLMVLWISFKLDLLIFDAYYLSDIIVSYIPSCDKLRLDTITVNIFRIQLRKLMGQLSIYYEMKMIGCNSRTIPGKIFTDTITTLDCIVKKTHRYNAGAITWENR